MGIAAARLGRSAWPARRGGSRVGRGSGGGVFKGEPTVLVLLFLTGLCSMGMEVIWTRQYTVYVGTVVYSFASILAV